MRNRPYDEVKGDFLLTLIVFGAFLLVVGMAL